MGLRFIFMLTVDDRTVPEAFEYLDVALRAGIRHIGFKDIGLPKEQLKELNVRIKAAGANSYLEVVSLNRQSERVSAEVAVEIGVDVLLGGTHVDDVLPILAGCDTQYYPFPGRIECHPSVLKGSIEEIVLSAKRLSEKEGVDGLDLLAYRAEQDVPKLMEAVCAVSAKPVLVAGSVSSLQKIKEIKRAGGAGFTVGTAAINGGYSASRSGLYEQLTEIMKDVAVTNKHISPHYKKALQQLFHSFNETWSPKIVGEVNEAQIKVVKFKGAFVWHYHADEDELFLVHSGSLQMNFRDRSEIIEAGEFIVVPRGVEHCPIALTDVCEIVLFEPKATLNTGNAKNGKTVRTLERI